MKLKIIILVMALALSSCRLPTLPTITQTPTTSPPLATSIAPQLSDIFPAATHTATVGAAGTPRGLP